MAAESSILTLSVNSVRLQIMLSERSLKPERIDTGDYTAEEYRVFLRDIAFINRFFGDGRALRRTLLHSMAKRREPFVSLLDVGCGSGELLLETARFGKRHGIRTRLFGIDLNPISAQIAHEKLAGIDSAAIVRADAFRLPFADGEFDYAISSLFFHHLSDRQAAAVLAEMQRVSRRGILIIDLRRSVAALLLYKLFCTVFRISPLVREDGSQSIKRAFRPAELLAIASAAGLKNAAVTRSLPFRLILRT